MTARAARVSVDAWRARLVVTSTLLAATLTSPHVHAARGAIDNITRTSAGLSDKITSTSDTIIEKSISDTMEQL